MIWLVVTAHLVSDFSKLFNLKFASEEPVILSSLVIREMHFIINGQAMIVPVEISQEECVSTVKEKASNSNVVRNDEAIGVSSTVSPPSGRLRGKGTHVGAPLVLIPDYAKPILKQEVVMGSI